MIYFYVTLVANINLELQMSLEQFVFLNQKKSIKDIFTKVLKGHIAVAKTNLKKDNTGNKIDIRARKFLKKRWLRLCAWNWSWCWFLFKCS